MAEAPQGRGRATVGRARSSQTRGVRWQMGIAAALGLTAFLAARTDASIVGAGFVIMWLCCMPPMLIAWIIPIPADLGELPYAFVLGLATFIIIALVLTPLRRWIDDPERRRHHARVGAVVGAAYVVTSLVVGYVWIAFSGR